MINYFWLFFQHIIRSLRRFYSANGGSPFDRRACFCFLLERWLFKQPHRNQPTAESAARKNSHDYK